jgi:hypothetical protein
MGQAQWAGPRTARKSTAQERPGTEGSVPRAGPARLSGRAWAASSARRPNTGPARRGPCLGLARHDYRAVPGPPPRHGGPTRARHENPSGPTEARASPRPYSTAVGLDDLGPLDRHLEAEYISIPHWLTPHPNPRRSPHPHSQARSRLSGSP